MNDKLRDLLAQASTRVVAANIEREAEEMRQQEEEQ
jgi:hypothetical protein